MAVKRFSTSFISESGQDKSSNFIANYSPAIDEMDLIERVRVGSGGTSAIEFTNIPATYQHLQIRGIHQIGTVDRGLALQFNSDTGSNYASHELVGNGSSALAYGAASQVNIFTAYNYATSGYSSSYFVGFIIDILDYTSVSKAKTVRALCGVDYNGSGRVEMRSGLWTSTNAVTSIKLSSFSVGTIVQHSTAALYGVKA